MTDVAVVAVVDVAVAATVAALAAATSWLSRCVCVRCKKIIHVTLTDYSKSEIWPSDLNLTSIIDVK